MTRPTVAQTASNAPAPTWIDKIGPSAVRPYLRLMRLDRPIGTWLLLLPGWWAIAAAPTDQGWEFRLWVGLLFAVGAVVMRGAGCVVNDILDRDFDAQVARTRTRPIPSGQVSVFQALVFLAFLASIGLAILLSFNRLTILLGILSLGLIVVYPLMKRVTWWPQAFLGITFNWGALMGWTAVSGELAAPALLLYAAGFFWTLGYDTIYAHQDKEDDALIGVKSSALALGDRTHRWVTVFYAMAVILLAAAGLTAGFGVIFLVGVVLVAGHFVWQLRALQIDDPANCWRLFNANRDTGLIFLTALIIGRITI
ncbi:MAG: 4-hydroxybenzoate octaprenyltransferase [Pseudomonadota bacterium]